MMKCCMATVPSGSFRSIRTLSQPAAIFPLTPTLSPGEREDTCMLVGESVAGGTCEVCTQRFPLPKGEGKGEGEQAVLQPHAPDLYLSSIGG
jgi:hypothetical protein